MAPASTRLLLAFLVSLGLGCPSSDGDSTDDAGTDGSLGTGGTSIASSGGTHAAGGTAGAADAADDGSGGMTGVDSHGACSTGGAGGDNCGTTTCQVGQCCCGGVCVSSPDRCF
jgi:hypothetical protein